jgi:hypothetical protein
MEVCYCLFELKKEATLLLEVMFNQKIEPNVAVLSRKIKNFGYSLARILRHQNCNI